MPKNQLSALDKNVAQTTRCSFCVSMNFEREFGLLKHGTFISAGFILKSCVLAYDFLH